jgi:hypothetical protein
MQLTKAWLYAAVAAAALATTAPASAEVVFAGFTNGCFGAGCVPSSLNNGGSTEVTNGGALTFRTSTFNDITSDNFLALGGNPADPNVNNLGTITVAAVQDNFNQPSDDFTLRVTFTLPAGTAPNNSVFFADVSGSVNPNGGGGVFLDFDNAFRTFTFAGGTFQFAVSDVNVNAGQTGSINGRIIVPGPIAGAGIPALMALGGFVWARRRKAAATA